MNNKNGEVVWLSLGENCLPDDILKRHELKSFSTPYSSGRSNIDYALALEATNYATLLDRDALARGDVYGAPVVRSTRFVESDPIFDPMHVRGFEFTHADPISSEKDRESYGRKIARLLAIRGKLGVVFLYHHRRTDKSNLPLLREKLERFAELYSSDVAQCTIALFHQEKIDPQRDRRLETTHSRNLAEYVFHTEHMWAGSDPDLFWARTDDDLIGSMLVDIASHAKHRRVDDVDRLGIFAEAA